MNSGFRRVAAVSGRSLIFSFLDNVAFRIPPTRTLVTRLLVNSKTFLAVHEPVITFLVFYMSLMLNVRKYC